MCWVIAGNDRKIQARLAAINTAYVSHGIYVRGPVRAPGDDAQSARVGAPWGLWARPHTTSVCAAYIIYHL